MLAPYAVLEALVIEEVGASLSSVALSLLFLFPAPVIFASLASLSSELFAAALAFSLLALTVAPLPSALTLTAFQLRLFCLEIEGEGGGDDQGEKREQEKEGKGAVRHSRNARAISERKLKSKLYRGKRRIVRGKVGSAWKRRAW